MKGLLSFVSILLFVCFASASIFSGGDVSPANNPTVDKYHTNGDFKKVAEKIIVFSVIGALGAVLLLTVTIIYYFFRFCRKFLCCCIKACRVNKTRARSDSLERELMDANPFVSWIFRIAIILLFLLVVALVIVGFIASIEVHKNIVETTSTIDKSVSSLNDTVYHTDYTFTHLIDVQINQSIIDDWNDLMNSTNTLAIDAHHLNTVAPHLDSIRNNSALAVYVLVFIPMLVGLVGAILGRSRFTAIMGFILPWLVIGFWILFAFHFCMFAINVDVCYLIDDALTTNYTETVTQTNNKLNFNCSDLILSATPVLDELNVLANLTSWLISNTTNATLKEEYTNQLYNIQNITSDVSDLADCSSINAIMTVAYPDLCGKAISASLFLWRSQIAIAVVLLVTCIVGLISENKIIPARKSRKNDYSHVALLN